MGSAMTSPSSRARTSDAPLDAALLAALRGARAELTRAELLVALGPGVGRTALASALAGEPLRSSTRELIRLGLERVAKSDASCGACLEMLAHGDNDPRGLPHTCAQAQHELDRLAKESGR
jgi:hypothetical protein